MTTAIDRWAVLGVQDTLFNEAAVVIGWGRRGTDQARWHILPVDTRSQAHDLAQRIVAAKLKRGYQIADNRLTD